MKYSIIIPAHSEAITIERHLDRLISQMSDAVLNVLLEIIIVENGSKDDTLEVCYRLQQQFPELIRVFSNDRPSYGEAIKRGIIESRGTHLSILESDFLDARFVKNSIDLFLSSQAQFIVASKRHPDSVDARPLKRRVLTWAFNRILNAVTGYPGSDTHGLKSIETKLAKELCQLAITTDEIFQTEIVLIAWRLGKTIDELPISVEESRAPSISIVRRLPKVVNLVSKLRKSIKRFPLDGARQSSQSMLG